MDEHLKNTIGRILVVLCIIFLLASVNSCAEVRRLRQERDKERLDRFNTEEKLHLVKSERTGMERDIQRVQSDYDALKKAHQDTAQQLSEAQGTIKDLNEEIAKLKKLKETLEEDLKEALISIKAERTRRDK